MENPKNEPLEGAVQPTLDDSSRQSSISHDIEKQPIQGNQKSLSVPIQSGIEPENLVNWDGPDDPENPMNWNNKRKGMILGIVSLITMLSPLTSTIISPATAAVLEDFDSTDATVGSFITSVYLLGYVAGPLFIAPMSEMYGRALMYNSCNFIFLVFNIACAVSNNLGALIAFRFFAGLAASCPITLSMATVADCVRVERRGAATGLMFLGPLIGPATAPLIGSYLAAAKGWRWIFWLASILAGAVLILTLLFTRETYAFVILDQKTKRLRKQTGNMQLRSALDNGRTPREHFTMSIVRPLKMLLLSPIVLSLSFYTAVVYGYLYLMFVTFPRVFEGIYGFSSRSIGLTYLGVGIGSFIGLAICGLVSDRMLAMLTKRNGGVRKPEYRLPPLVLGAFIIPFGLFLYGWSAERHWHWMVPIIGTAFVGGGLFFVFMPIGVYFIDTFEQYSASATASNTVLRSLLGALLPLTGDAMYDSLGVGWGTSVLGFIAVGFIPVAFIFQIFGERIRKLTRVEF